jgi:hypothetical protein
MTRNKKITHLFVIINFFCAVGFLFGDEKNPIVNVMKDLETKGPSKVPKKDLNERRSRSRSL